MNPGLYLKTILKQKHILLYWVIAGMFFAVLAFYLQKPVYITSSKWFVQKASSDSMFSGGGSSGEKNLMASVAGSLFKGGSGNTTGIDAAILHSPEILKSIIEKANLVDKKGKPIDFKVLRKRFTIKTDKKLPFITVKYASSSPVEAYEVLKLAEEVFIEKNITAEAKKAELNRIFLEEQVNKAEFSSHLSAKELRDYEKRAKVVNIDEEAKAQQERLLRLQSEIADDEARLNSIKTKIKDLKSKLNLSSAREAIEKSTIGSDVDISALKNELIKKNNRLINLQVKYTDTHHAVKEAKEEIGKLKEEIEKRQKILIGKSMPADEIEDVKSVTRYMISELVNLSTEELALNSKIKAVNENLNTFSKNFSALPTKKYNITSLEFESDFQKSRLEALRLSLETAKINEAFAKNTISIIKLDEAEMPNPERPNYPNMTLNLVIGVLLGLLFGYTNIVVVETIENKIRNHEQIEALSTATFLGELTCTNNEDMNKNLITYYEDIDDINEEYRKLRTNLRYLKIDDKAKSISFIHSDESINYALALTNLAIACAKGNNKVALIETNLRKPVLHEILNIKNINHGLTDYLAGSVSSYSEVIKSVHLVDNMYFLPAGIIPPNPSDILDSEKMKQFIEQITNEYDFVLFNLPPFKAYADSLIVANNLNGNILVAEASTSKVNDFVHTQNVLKKHNVEVLGSILINIEAP